MPYDFTIYSFQGLLNYLKRLEVLPELSAREEEIKSQIEDELQSRSSKCSL